MVVPTGTEIDASSLGVPTTSAAAASTTTTTTTSNVLLVKPPPDIRAVVDRTALFVSKNGRTFEQRILNSAKGKTPKFAFLYETSPFHAYYESRIAFYLSNENKTEDQEEEEEQAMKKKDDQKKEDEAAIQVSKEQSDEGKEPTSEGIVVTSSSSSKKKKKTIIDPLSREILQIRQNLRRSGSDNDDGTVAQGSPPPPFKFLHIVAPSNITSVQIEIIKICAQFTALARLIPNESTVGNTFLNTLRHREWSSTTTYGFLQPRHAHFAYFTALVDAYYQLLLKLRDDDNDNAAARTTTIKESLHEACYRAEYARYLQEEEAKRQAGDDTYAAVATVDWHDFVVVETIDFPQDEVVQVRPPPPLPPPPPTTAKATTTTSVVVVPEEEEVDSEALHIVSDYTPRVVPTTTAKELSKSTVMIDPISGKPIPVADLSEHMRIQLLDPKWALEKKRFQDKQRESNLLSQGDDIAKNIRRLYSSTTSTTDKNINDSEEITARVNIPNDQEEKGNILNQQQWQPQEVINSNIMDRSISMQMMPAATPSLFPYVEPNNSNIAAAIPYPAATEQSDITSISAGYKRPLLEENGVVVPAVGGSILATDTTYPPSSKKTRIEEEIIPPIAAVTTTEILTGVHGVLLPPVVPPTFEAAVGVVVPPMEENVGVAAEEEVEEQESSTPWVPLDTITLTIRSPEAKPVVLVIEDAQKRTVKSIKESVHQQLGGTIPVNKMQFKVGRLGLFLKDASFIGNVEGIMDAETIDLIPKVRGGRK